MNDDRQDTIQLYNAANEQEAHLLKTALQSQGIRAVVEGGTLQIARGRIPFSPETLPCVIVFKQDERAARRVLDRFLDEMKGRTPQEPWSCPGCGQSVPGGFEICWNCQSTRPDGQAGS